MLQREAREAEARKKKKNGNNDGRKKKKNPSRKGNKAGRKHNGGKGNAKKNEENGRRAGRRNGKKKKNNGNQKRRGKKLRGRKTSSDQRQNSTDCLSDVIQTIKDYKKAANHLRMAKRVSSWTEQMGKKKTKAASSFQDGLDALDSATGGGASCNGGAADANATEALNTLKNCSKTAAALCDSATLNTSNVDSCKTSLQAQIDAFDVSSLIAFISLFPSFPPRFMFFSKCAGLSEDGDLRLFQGSPRIRHLLHLHQGPEHGSQDRQDQVQQSQ